MAHLIQLVAAQIRILDWAWLAQMAEFDPRYLHLIAYSGEGDGLFRPMVIIGSGVRDGRGRPQDGLDRRRDCLSH
ncbi:MAG: hypothetical protein ABW003_27870 [Microvirga sp.]